MRVGALLIGLLLIPSGAAQTLQWVGPSEGVENSPLFFAYRMDDGNGDLEGHVNVELTISLDGYPLFVTQQLHEHEGFHTFTVTPPAAGELVLSAIVAGAEATHAVNVRTAEPPQLPAFPEGRFIMGQNQEGQNEITTGDGAMRVHGTTGWALVEGRVDGETRFSAWQANGDGSTVRETAFEAYGIFTDSPHQPSGRGATLVDAGTWPATDESVQPVLLPGLPRPEPCADSEVDVILDPTSLSPAGNPQFQEHATIRVAIPNNPYSRVMYGLNEAASEASTRTIVAFSTRDPFAQALIQPDGPGSMRLLVSGTSGEGGREQCAIFFDVTPNPAESGSVETVIETHTHGADVTFTPLDSAGNTIGHYEFDTRVLRLEDAAPGRLVYQGKLHGHSGATSFSLQNLEPGNYLLRTHPSPQDPTSPPVAPATDAGFVYEFHIPESAGSAPLYVFSKETEVGQEKSTPINGFPLLLLGLAWMCLRRR